MEAPPYSPTATSSERRMPDDYRSVERDESDEEHEDPLQGLIRRPKKNTSRPPANLQISHNRHLSASSSSSGARNLQPIATAPATTITFAIDDSFDDSLELPPEYAPIDEFARSFRLEAPFIYTTKTSSIPRYQLMQEFTRSGRPRRLCIRRLLPTETRSNSLPTSNLSAPYRPAIRYDDDSTMYSCMVYELPGLSQRTFEMKGHRGSTLNGNIRFEKCKSLFGTRHLKIWHLTKDARKDSLNPENDARMQKYGYHASEEWDKKQLYCVKKGVWVDGKGRLVGRESENGEFEVEDRIGSEGWKRDLAVSCWVMSLWIKEGLRWEGDTRGR